MTAERFPPAAGNVIILPKEPLAFFPHHSIVTPPAMLPLFSLAQRFWLSSIGKKIIVALTGLVLVGFLAGHLTGNLLIFGGAEALACAFTLEGS